MDSSLLDELIQCVLLVLPLCNLKCIIDPFGMIVAKHINFLLILTLLVHTKGCFAAVPIVFFLDAPFDGHWNMLILLPEFHHFILQIRVDFEILQSIITHPSIDLFVKLDGLRLDCRLRR